MIKIENLSVSYDKKPALSDVSVQFLPNQITGLIGPNGAGKSTLMKTCIGLISEYSGHIYFAGKNSRENRFWVKQHAVYTSENAELLPYLSGREFLNLISGIHKLDANNLHLDFMINLTGLHSKQNELIINYSHGMRQKLSIASALLPNPDYILIDETLNGLDSVSLKSVHAYLKNQAAENRVIVVSSHNVDLIKDLCDEVYVIYNGKIVYRFAKEELLKFAGTNDLFINKYISIINEYSL